LRGTNEGQEAGGALIKAAKSGYNTILSVLYRFDARFRKSLFE
jgi:hexosaminidase